MPRNQSKVFHFLFCYNKLSCRLRTDLLNVNKKQTVYLWIKTCRLGAFLQYHRFELSCNWSPSVVIDVGIDHDVGVGGTIWRLSSDLLGRYWALVYHRAGFAVWHVDTACDAGADARTRTHARTPRTHTAHAHSGTSTYNVNPICDGSKESAIGARSFGESAFRSLEKLKSLQKFYNKTENLEHLYST